MITLDETLPDSARDMDSIAGAFFCGVALLRGSRDGGHGQGRKPVCEYGAGGCMWSWRRTVVGEGGDSPLGNK